MAQQSLIRTANDICVYVHSGTNMRLNQAQNPSDPVHHRGQTTSLRRWSHRNRRTGARALILERDSDRPAALQIVVQKDMTWEGFKAAVGQRLGIQTGRIFNAHDEITKVPRSNPEPLAGPPPKK
jgi:hypothetical protein